MGPRGSINETPGKRKYQKTTKTSPPQRDGDTKKTKITSYPENGETPKNKNKTKKPPQGDGNTKKQLKK